MQNTGTKVGDVKVGDWVTLVYNTTGIPDEAVGQFVQITKVSGDRLYYTDRRGNWYVRPSDVLVGPAYD